MFINKINKGEKFPLMRRLHNNNSGFTLMEVLVAMVILTVGLLGMAALIAGIINSNKLSNRISTATVLAQDKMEDIRRMKYLDVAPEPSSIITDYPLYKRKVAVATLTGMKKITVTVYWDADDHSVALQTILAE
jgi:type IV pilus assembly protein PilV